MTAPATLLRDLRAGRLAGTTRLDLRDAGLREVPREIFTLAPSLETLDLSGNELDALPDDLPRLQHLQTLFCSGNRFTELPPVLGRCERLAIVGFKANAIEHVAANALPATLHWLILTDNRIGALPETLGDCVGMRKLMLAGNRLRALPAGLGECRQLELLRIAANRFESAEDALPAALLALPRLAWLAFAGNPFGAAEEARVVTTNAAAQVEWTELQVGALLGEGASGWIHAAEWPSRDGGIHRPVALKRFKGAVTSDGLPASEMAACLRAGSHPHLVGVEGELAGHPRGERGLVMRRIPPGYRNLAGPPSLASCTRDVYAEGTRFTVAHARAVASAMASALAHLHARGLMHGDLYAHNILLDADGHALLGDFGAASFLPHGDSARQEALRQIDRRALGVLIDELALRCGDALALDDLR